MDDRFAFEDLRFPGDGSVISDISIDVGRTERIAVFGPNGAGKSSLLRAIAGTIPGAVRRSAVAYLPQTPYMFRGSARANLVLGRSDPRRAEELAAVLGVSDLLDAPARSLSGGEAQRLSIARVLGGDEALVAMDEPLAPIDGVDRSSVASVIREATDDRALVCVSHSIDTAAAIAETLIVLESGQIVQRGPVAEVLATPVDETVAKLVGIANVLVGTVTSADGGVANVSIGSITVAAALDAPVGSTAVLRIPAETIAVFTEEPHGVSLRTVVEGTVERLIPRGSAIEVVMGGETELVATVTSGALDALGIAVGSKVWFGLKATAVDVVRSG